MLIIEKIGASILSGFAILVPVIFLRTGRLKIIGVLTAYSLIQIVTYLTCPNLLGNTASSISLVMPYFIFFYRKK